MVVDNLKNADLYYGMSERISSAFKFLRDNDFSKMEPGRYDIDGNKLYALIQSYDSKPLEQGKWEAHRKYIDIQYIFSGMEKMGYANITGMSISKEYDQDGDYLLLEGEGSFFTVKPGFFAVFAPEDAHMPGICAVDPAKVGKVVVKILI